MRLAATHKFHTNDNNNIQQRSNQNWSAPIIKSKKNMKSKEYEECLGSLAGATNYYEKASTP